MKSIFGGYLGWALKKGLPVRLFRDYFSGGWNFTQFCGDYFMNHENKDPASLNNQDSMESRSFFFFRGASGGILFFNWASLFAWEETNKKRREKQNKRPFFPTHQYLLNPTRSKTRCVFFYLKKMRLPRKWHEIPQVVLPSRPRWIEVYGECPVLVVCEWKPCTEFGFTTPYGCLHGGCNAGREIFFSGESLR